MIAAFLIGLFLILNILFIFSAMKVNSIVNKEEEEIWKKKQKKKNSKK